MSYIKPDLDLPSYIKDSIMCLAVGFRLDISKRYSVTSEFYLCDGRKKEEEEETEEEEEQTGGGGGEIITFYNVESWLFKP